MASEKKVLSGGFGGRGQGVSGRWRGYLIESGSSFYIVCLRNLVDDLIEWETAVTTFFSSGRSETKVVLVFHGLGCVKSQATTSVLYAILQFFSSVQSSTAQHPLFLGNPHMHSGLKKHICTSMKTECGNEKIDNSATCFWNCQILFFLSFLMVMEGAKAYPLYITFQTWNRNVSFFFSNSIHYQWYRLSQNRSKPKSNNNPFSFSRFPRHHFFAFFVLF